MCLCSKNKGVVQLCGYHEADWRLFHIYIYANIGASHDEAHIQEREILTRVEWIEIGNININSILISTSLYRYSHIFRLTRNSYTNCAILYRITLHFLYKLQ